MIIYDKGRFGSARTVDDNGFLRVETSNITKEQVRPYLGREIPNWQGFGLDENKIYGVYCPASELRKAAHTFDNLPLTRKHITVDIDNVPSKDIVGSLGDNCTFDGTYLTNSLIVYDRSEIKNIQNGRKKELSCGYRYTPVRQSGVFDGQPYDFIMTDIVGNHVALVKAGRAGHDVAVADEIPSELEEPQEAGEVALINGESEMAEEAQAPEEEVKEVLTTEDACSKDEDKEEAKKDKADKPAESKEEKKEEEKNFAEGVKYGEEKEKEEPKKLDSEHESEGMKKADKKKEAEDKCSTKDEALTMDIDAIKAEAHEAGKQEAIADFKARENARKEVRHILGDVNVFSFDSADEIYKLACEKGGLNCEDITSYKDAFKGLSLAKSKLVADASPAQSAGNEECFKNIRLS